MAQQKIDYVKGEIVEDLALESDATSLSSTSVRVIFADGLTKLEMADALDKARRVVLEAALPNS